MDNQKSPKPGIDQPGTAHVSALQHRHASLERQLHAERSRPRPDDTTIKVLKRDKLRIKDAIEAAPLPR